MKTILTIIIICLSGLLAQSHIDKRKLEKTLSEKYQSEINFLNESNKNLLAGLSERDLKIEKLNDSLKIMVEEVKKDPPIVIESSPEKVEEVEEIKIDNTPLYEAISNLENQKINNEDLYNRKLAELDSFLKSGDEAMKKHRAVDPNFKEGAIRTSDADRKRWQDDYDERGRIIQSKIDNIKMEKERLTRAFHSAQGKIDLEILSTRRNIQ